MDRKNVICEYLGGSHLYGLNTPESDEDVRGLFVNSQPMYILGTRRFDEQRNQNPALKEDVVYKEVSHFFRLLAQSNSEALEALFAKESSFSLLTPEFRRIQQLRYEFVDSKRLYDCLRGYMASEYRLAIGERKGQIGGKRYAKLQEVGFSPKNFTQLFRLAYCGKTFFLEDRFPVDMRDESIHEFLMDVKVRPEKFNKDVLTEKYREAEKELDAAFEKRILNRKFHEDMANQILLELYRPYICKHED